jgi:hypothetical protein
METKVRFGVRDGRDALEDISVSLVFLPAKQL